MRILFVTQWFDPEPTFTGLAFAQELTRLGHRVQVLTGFPNYPVRDAGPAVVEQLDTTTVIHPEQEATVDDYRNIIIKEKR